MLKAFEGLSPYTLALFGKSCFCMEKPEGPRTMEAEKYQHGWKWFQPASRSSLNPPGAREKAKDHCFRTRCCTEQIRRINSTNPLKGHYFAVSQVFALVCWHPSSAHEMAMLRSGAQSANVAGGISSRQSFKLRHTAKIQPFNGPYVAYIASCSL